MSQATPNVFDDLGFDAIEAANMKVRAELLLEVREYIRAKGLKRQEAAAMLGVQPAELKALMDGAIFQFNLDALVNMLAKIGRELKVTTRQRQSA